MPIDRAAAERAIADFLRALGHDPNEAPELRQTPALVAAAFADELLGGYAVDLRALLSEGTPARDEGIVVLGDLRVVTVCPHHLLPAQGHATVAYLPGARVFGLGNIARLVDACARRLVLQEAIGRDAVRALMELGGARGAFCRISLSHACLSARGARQHDAKVVTEAAAGELAGPHSAPVLARALAGVSQ